jgi:Ni,Fe-hydrogenase III large subunit/Ni,Fe-hydrogenase III component G
MNEIGVIKDIETKLSIPPISVETPHPDEVYASVGPEDFAVVCKFLHKRLESPVMTLFAVDERAGTGNFDLYCVFESVELKKWFLVKTALPGDKPRFWTLSKEIFSAHLFEREMKEMFGIEPFGNPDTRRLNLHDEVWPEGSYPLRKDFKQPESGTAAQGDYPFNRIEGEGVFEVPVGPVHAGIIGPGHFRFSVAGEPIINLELRLGFTHRGVEKLFEGKNISEAIPLSECVSGDASFAHSLAFCNAAEKICGMTVSRNAQLLRALFLELERMYNHANDIGGIAVDVGFSFPQAYASIMKETILVLNEKLTGSRYLKGVNRAGGVAKGIADADKGTLLQTLDTLARDLAELKQMLFESVSFMDRVDTTGTLAKRLAEDLGVTGLAARASGIGKDLRRDFPGVYGDAGFKPAKHSSGDVLARLNVRIAEFEESIRLIREFSAMLAAGEEMPAEDFQTKSGCGFGYVEGWRGPVLYWVKLDADGRIDRCKITDASFKNWQGLAYCVHGNIIPDFPLCNKSFDLSYSGNDL